MKWLFRSVAAGFVVVLLFPALSVAAEETLTLPAGSTLSVRLITTLSTRTNENGDPFSAKIIEPIIYDSAEVVPAGSILEGRVAFVKQPGKVKGVGEMRLVAETITTPDEVRYSISAGLEEAEGAEGAKVRDEEGTIKGPSSKKGDIVNTGVGAGVGAAAGAITAGGKGSLYGAGIGAAVMGVRSLFKRGKDIILPQGTELTFVINRTTTAKRVKGESGSSTE
jgi:hypothetical protein